jgi:hypothetical protein
MKRRIENGGIGGVISGGGGGIRREKWRKQKMNIAGSEISSAISKRESWRRIGEMAKMKEMKSMA